MRNWNKTGIKNSICPDQCPEECLAMYLGQTFLCRKWYWSGHMRNWNKTGIKNSICPDSAQRNVWPCIWDRHSSAGDGTGRAYAELE